MFPFYTADQNIKPERKSNRSRIYGTEKSMDVPGYEKEKQIWIPGSRRYPWHRSADGPAALRRNPSVIIPGDK